MGRNFLDMKTLIVFLALFASLTANAQQKTWGGTTAVLYPNMATGFKIYSNGSFSISNETNKLSMSGGALLLDGAAIPAAAGTLTGSTLASGVTASSLTSVGTLGSLTVSGASSSGSESITGTGGAGYLGIAAQSSAPSAPAGGYRQYADSAGRLSWIRASDGFTRTFDATLTTNRVYTLPDASITFARTDAAQTFSGNQTFVNLLASGSMIPNSITLSYHNQDCYIQRKSAANIRQGAADAAAPVAQSHSVQSVVTGTSNTAGANRTFEGSIGTGTGTGGSIIFQTAPAGSTGTAQNALATALTISGEGNLVQPVAKTYSVASGTNQRAGNAVLVGGTVTVTNSTVTANTLVMHARKTIGGTVGNMRYTTSAGNSFTITSDQAADTSTVSYFLIENP